MIQELMLLSSAVISFVSYFSLYYCLGQIANSTTLPKRLGIPKLHIVLNVSVSLFNSFLQSFFSYTLFISFFWYPETYNYWISPWAVNFFTYLVYDTICCSWYDFHIFRQEPGLIVHHIIVMTSLIASLLDDPYIMFYQVIATLCEFNSIHLHTKAILKHIYPDFSWLRWPNEVANFLTFATWRYISSCYLVWRAIEVFESSGNLKFYKSSFWVLLAIALWMVNNVIGIALVRGYLRMWNRNSKG